MCTLHAKSSPIVKKGARECAYVVGVAGGSASGQTSVAQAILKGMPDCSCVGIISQDSFYKQLDHEQQRIANLNEYDFDHPNAFDFDKLRSCIEE